MAQKYDEPPAYGHGGPQAPQQAYYPPQQGPGGYGAPPPQGGHGQDYYQPGPQMGYGQQPGYGPPHQGGYYPQGQPQGHYGNDRKSGPGFFEACLAGMACCCCLDILF
ncbi:hypothetical protein B0H66DRAFT_603098 [Apodospora peruviana]|uniref:Cysteine-rich transmembrane CYSTM domain-containing protein n=1 Tax=Apodospora peruviana TaxID=516989 RepID=A0AAE0M5E5_9PEZI|nr:hypothetical protein B0H66DRAFT_603098 [Apodospora peruviana]